MTYAPMPDRFRGVDRLFLPCDRCGTVPVPPAQVAATTPGDLLCSYCLNPAVPLTARQRQVAQPIHHTVPPRYRPQVGRTAA